MKFSRIFKETMLFWPSKINISDGKILESNKASFPALNNAWESAEVHAEIWSEWHQLMVWAIYGGLHRLAKEELGKGESIISKKDIDIRYVEKKFSDNLFTNIEPGYPRQMRRAYINDLKP